MGIVGQQDYIWYCGYRSDGHMSTPACWYCAHCGCATNGTVEHSNENLRSSKGYSFPAWVIRSAIFILSVCSLLSPMALSNLSMSPNAPQLRSLLQLEHVNVESTTRRIIPTTTHVPTLRLRVPLFLMYGIAVAAYYHMHRRDPYQGYMVLCACVASACISWLLWHDMRDVVLIGLPWGATAGLLGSAMVHEVWGLRNKRSCNYESCEEKIGGRIVETAAVESDP